MPVIEKNISAPLHIIQALIGWASVDSDPAILRFVDLIAERAVIDSAFLLHIVRRFEDLAQKGQGLAPVQAMKQSVAEQFEDGDRIFWEYEVREGDILEELALTASDLRSDVVFIGRMEDAGVAPKLARLTPGALCIVPVDFRPRLGRILVGTDFSESSGRALQLACSLAPSGEIVCVHYYEMPAPKYLAGKKARNDLASGILENRKEAFSIFLETYLPEGLSTVSTEIHPALQGAIGPELSRLAKEDGFDLAVLGLKGLSPAEQLAPGSVAESFIRHCTGTPVWLVK